MNTENKDPNQVPDTGHSWDDGAIRELINDPPGWWVLLFHASVIFAIAYFIRYPSIPLPGGETPGVAGWTSIQEYHQSLAERDAVRAPWEARLEPLSAQQVLLTDSLNNEPAANALLMAAQDLLDSLRLDFDSSEERVTRALERNQEGLDSTAFISAYQGISDELKAILPSTGFSRQATAEASVKAAQEVIYSSKLTEYTLRSAKVLFGDKCAACHGSGGQGNVGFPVLVDDDWLYGGKIENIVQTLQNGRRGVMPPHEASLSTEETNDLVQYLVGLPQGEEHAAGQALYTSKGCVGCHGVDAKGNPFLGSANLTDAVMRFVPEEGESIADSIRHTILYGVNSGHAQGRDAVMPKFGDRLSAQEIERLSVYVWKFGGGQ